MSQNKTYVKRFDENGKLLNPITKEKPFQSIALIPVYKAGVVADHEPGPNRQQRRSKAKKGNNRKRTLGRTRA